MVILQADKRVWVFMIHKPGSGESVTLCDELPPGCENPYHFIHRATIQMRKFQREAVLVRDAESRAFRVSMGAVDQ